jgi:hypothetical protein
VLLVAEPVVVLVVEPVAVLVVEPVAALVEALVAGPAARRVASRTEPAPDEIKPAPGQVPVGGAYWRKWPTIPKRLLKGILL